MLQVWRHNAYHKNNLFIIQIETVLTTLVSDRFELKQRWIWEYCGLYSFTSEIQSLTHKQLHLVWAINSGLLEKQMVTVWDRTKVK